MTHPSRSALRTRALLAFALLATAAYSQVAPTSSPTGRPPSTETEDESTIVLSPFEVTSTTDRGYQATETLAGTRIRTNLADVGAAISVVTKELLTDLGATDNSTLLQYTPNAEVAGTRGTYAGLGNGTSVDETANLRAPGGAQRVRGLSAADNTRDFFVSDIPWDSFNVDRVDIQRGPNSILFGLGKPAGIVNATTRNAELHRTRGEVLGRVGSYGSWRTSVDFNQVVIADTLAIRVSALRDEEKFQQKPAFENDERIYGAVRWDPQLFRDRSARTSIKLKYEHGEIDANRPRIVPPNDHITPFFRPKNHPLGGVDRAILTNSFAANRETTPAVGGDNMGQMRSVDPDYNAWYAGVGNDQQPFYFIDGNSGQTYRIYGGFINNGARNADGSIRANNSAILGRRYGAVFHTLTGLNGYASSARLPGYQYGQYREQTLMDESIFDFYNNLIDGPTKAEWENWDAYNVNLSQTAFDDRLGVELIYDRQKYDRGGQSALGFQPTLNIDVLGAFQDLGANPNVGRPFVQANGNGSSYLSDREYVRGSLFAELRPSDWTQNEFLRKLFGRQRFNGVYSGEEFYSETRSWNLYSTTAAFDTFTTVNVRFDDRPPLGVVYLGPAIHTKTSASGSDIPRIGAPIELNDGSLYHFSSQWVNFNVPFNQPWTPPNDIVFNQSDANAQVQAANPANYKGWNTDYYLDIARYADGDDSLITGASKALRKVASYAGSWQSFLWDDALVGTFGWRYDHVRNRDVKANSTGPRSTFVTTPGIFELPSTDSGEFKEHSTSWGAVLHVNKLLPDDRLPFNVSFSYNESNNFEVSSARRNLYGALISNPTGETKDYGILLSTKDNRYSLRAIKYEASVQNASTQAGNLNYVLGSFVADGLRWRNVFLYDLNAYTLDTANGANEWRYNFDPDTTVGETQEQATARENAAINAWNQIQARMPAAFYQAWGFTPPADLANPKTSEVYSYHPATAPSGLTLTSDTISKGYEFEFIANPTPNWRVIMNGSRTQASRSNVGSAETLDYVNYLSEMMAGPAGELRQFSGGPTAATFRQNWNNNIGTWTLLRLQEGAAASEIRKWRYNVVTNYSFREGRLKGVGIGGSYRWQDKVIIGYPVVATSATQYTFDLANPYYGPSEDSFDAWLSYERKLTERIHWRIQLNGRNLFGKEELIPISVQPDGQTWASARIAPNREWFLTNTFSF
jgi:outer membrane receptor protein involved in Fe transport